MTALMLFTLAWITGILISQVMLVPLPWLLLAIPIALLLLVGWGDSRWSRRASAMLIALLLGAGRLVLALPQIDENHIAFYNDRDDIILEGVLDNELDIRFNHTLARMKATSITLPNGEKQNVLGHVLVTLPPYGVAQYGDRVVVEGRPETPPVFDTFSYKEHLALQGIYTVFDAKDYTVLASNQANAFKNAILDFKAYAHKIILKLYPEPQAALLSGILLGIESGIPDTLEDAFNATGTGHIVAISGFNLSILAGGFTFLTRRFFKKRGRLWVAIIGLWLYVILVGGSAAVLRAGVMSTLGIVATHEQRKVHGPTALAAAVFFLTLLNPYALWDVGFQLSFTATLGMVLYTQPLENRLQTILEGWFEPERATVLVRMFSESLLVTIAAQLVTVGVTVSTFQRISLVSLLTNFLILPMQIYIMLFGGMSLLVGLLFQPLAQLIAWIGWVFLAYTTTVVDLLARLPQASLSLGSGYTSLIWAYYTALAGVTWWVRSTREERQKYVSWVKTRNPTIVVAILAIIILAVITSVTVPDGKLRVTFLDVGAGEAVFIQTPHGRQVLVDGGRDGARTLAQVGRLLPFWDRNLDMIVLTSPDKDRLVGQIAVLNRYTVDKVVTGSESTSSDTYTEWVRIIDQLEMEQGPTTVTKAEAGNRWFLEDDIFLDVIWPPGTVSGPLVLKLTYGTLSILLPGDATTVVEEALVTQYRQHLYSTVLLVPRHGADTAATPAFLQSVDPEVVIATGDKPVSPYVLARLGDIPLYSTLKNGNVVCVLNGKTLKVNTSRE